MGLVAPSAGRSRHRLDQPRLQGRQLGQAAVFVFVFLPVLLVSLLFLYKSGKLTSDKMQLQNAADAAAYSASVIEARDLNFASYMNRAIVANEVGVGQSIGLLSWANHWRSIKEWLDLYALPMKGTPLAPLGAALSATGTVFKATGFPAQIFLYGMAQMSTSALHYVNRGYGFAQYGFHTASSAYALAAIMEMIDQNAPAGARLSEYGLLSLIGHFATYGSLPDLPGKKFTRNYDPLGRVPKRIFDRDESGTSDFDRDVAGESDAAGYARLAALIMDSSDPFIKQRGWDFDLFKELNRLGALPDLGIIKYSEDRDPLDPDDVVGWYGLDAGTNIDLGIFEVEWRLWLQLHLGLEREGGNELRYNLKPTALSDISGLVLGSDDTIGAGERFIWSGADTTNLKAGLKAGASVKAWIVIPIIDERIKVVDVGISGRIQNDRLRMYVNLFGSGRGCATSTDDDGNETENCESISGSEGLEIVNIPFPTNAPFSAGFAQAGTFIPDTGGLSNYHSNLPSAKLPPDFPQMGTEASLIYRGPIPRDAYGGASINLLAWEFPFTPPVPGGSKLTGEGVKTIAKKAAEEKGKKEATETITPWPQGIFHQTGIWPSKGSWLYAGLPRYTDTVRDPGNNDDRPLVGSGGPNLVVGVVLDETAFDMGADGTPENEPAENSRLGLSERLANDQLSVIAKSEVYFLRPTDLSWFRRDDWQEEYGSTFNPYWQARLTETSHADRAAALMLQQNVDVEALGGRPWNIVSAFYSLIDQQGF